MNSQGEKVGVLVDAMIEGTADMMKGTGTTIGIEVDMMIGTENGGMMIEIMIVIKDDKNNLQI